jgi:DNA-3-methyladenine glycosylase I
MPDQIAPDRFNLLERSCSRLARMADAVSYPAMSRYCEIAPGHPVHHDYHATEYGFPQRDEAVLFERLCLEIMQAGLSWEIVLKRRAGMREAFAGYVVDEVAGMDEAILLTNPAIIRNRLKVAAIISNARVIQEFRASHGGFAEWLDAHHPRDKAAWVKLFRGTFRFTGGEIVGEFLMSLGYLPGAHSQDCPVYHQLRALFSA